MGTIYVFASQMYSYKRYQAIREITVLASGILRIELCYQMILLQFLKTYGSLI